VIEKAAGERAQREIDERLAGAYAARARAKAAGQPFVDGNAMHGRFPGGCRLEGGPGGGAASACCCRCCEVPHMPPPQLPPCVPPTSPHMPALPPGPLPQAPCPTRCAPAPGSSPPSSGVCMTTLRASRARRRRRSRPREPPAPLGRCRSPKAARAAPRRHTARAPLTRSRRRLVARRARPPPPPTCAAASSPGCSAWTWLWPRTRRHTLPPCRTDRVRRSAVPGVPLGRRAAARPLPAPRCGCPVAPQHTHRCPPPFCRGQGSGERGCCAAGQRGGGPGGGQEHLCQGVPGRRLPPPRHRLLRRAGGAARGRAAPPARGAHRLVHPAARGGALPQGRR
jgi:hypothetical protein